MKKLSFLFLILLIVTISQAENFSKTAIPEIRNAVADSITGEIELPEIKGTQDWEKVLVTRNSEDVIGLNKVAELTTEASKPLTKQKKLLIEATDRMKKMAAGQHCQIILIQTEDFTKGGMNTVTLTGIGYKEKR